MDLYTMGDREFFIDFGIYLISQHAERIEWKKNRKVALEIYMSIFTNFKIV